MGLARSIGRALSGVRAGFGSLASEAAWLRGVPDAIAVSSTGFGHGADIPSRYTADGPGLSPPLAWAGVPSGARSVLLLVEDADIPLPVPLVHALAYDLPGSDGGLAEGAIPTHRQGPAESGWRLGRNSYGVQGWIPCSPPPGHGPHHYVIQVFALDSALAFEWPPGRGFALRAARGHVLARGSLVGIYERT